MRGEFIRGDGLVLPNNVTKTGAARILDLAFRTDNYPDFRYALGLCNAVYTPTMQFADLDIPVGNGYVPPLLTRRVADWYLELAAEEPYIQSRPVIFPAGNYNKTVTRLYLGEEQVQHVFALSSPFPRPLQVTTATPAAERTFQYRLYLR